MIISYTISGMLFQDVPWEDFFSNDKNFPSVTMSTTEAYKIPDGDDFFFEKNTDGWVDAYVRVLDKNTAVKVLSAINNVPIDQIAIEEKGVVMSV